MRIETIPVSPWTANCYLIAVDPSDNGYLVIDPGVRGSELVPAALDYLGRHPETILCMHGHLDHAGDAATPAAVWDVPARCARADQEMLTRPSAGLGSQLVPLIRQLIGEDELDPPGDLRDHETFRVSCGLEVRPHAAPGYTRGSTLLEVGDETRKVPLTGDVIFRGTVGRTDLPGGNLEQMRSTLRGIIEAFPDGTVLLPGHGEPTTVGAEKLQNPCLQADFLKDWTMARPKPISNFPEFLPAGRLAEDQVLVAITSTFELHGSAPVETRAVEPLDQLTRKGEIDEEIYVVRRLHAQEGDADELGLHFDLMVPFARYVLEHSGHLNLPFRRYQVQEIWRGERPQEGRYREFTQANIDIVGYDRLAGHHNAEIPLVAPDVFGGLHRDLGLLPVSIRVNNRKLSEGFYRGPGIESTAAMLQRVDKYDKVGPDVVAELLTEQAGLSETQARACAALAGISSENESFVDKVWTLGVIHELLERGLAGLVSLIRIARGTEPGRVVADLRIARRLGYYTGTVYETLLLGSEKLGSVASGGRYNSLASDGRMTFPGVGYSSGVTRILAPLIGKGVLTATRGVPSVVLVAVDSEETRDRAISVARRLWECSIACEVAPKADKFGRQIRFAERRGIPFVWFGANLGDLVKDIRSGGQLPVDLNAWLSPIEGATPRAIRG